MIKAKKVAKKIWETSRKQEDKDRYRAGKQGGKESSSNEQGTGNERVV